MNATIKLKTTAGIQGMPAVVRLWEKGEKAKGGEAIILVKLQILGKGKGENDMCTCIAMRGKHFYFGRNMDIECSFGERVVLMPRKFLYPYQFMGKESEGYAMIGMAAVYAGVPLYAEGMNECGVCMAALQFPGNAHYFSQPTQGKINVAPYELIPYLLRNCQTVSAAEERLRAVRLIDKPFLAELPLAQLHWMIADRERTIVAEPTEDGLAIYENPFDVLANNPEFGYHRQHVNEFLNVTAAHAENRMLKTLPLRPYGQGMGAIGLPGDCSSSSRFVRAVFYLHNSDRQSEGISQIFHILSGAEMIRGSVRTSSDQIDWTIYACGMDASDGIYYFKHYQNHRLSAVPFLRENLEGHALREFALEREEDVLICRSDPQ